VGGGGEAIDWNDDPCSLDGIEVGATTLDCAGDCPGYHPQPSEAVGCAPKAKCELTAPQLVSSDKPLGPQWENPEEFTNRTPRASTIDGPCDCPNGEPIFAKYRIYVALKDPSIVHLSVRAPWHLGTDPAATCAGEAQQCVEGSGTWNALLWTEYSNAPATNVLAKLGPCE
jgi:hypothetical protein